VYRARDTRLGRDVAIKVLPPAFANDADRLARFEREARVLASLDHPNIGTILGVEESDGVRALVLGLVDGETLAERIARGPIPMAEALESTPFAGTDNSNSPFFSPDGQWLGFWTGAVDSGAIGELKKMRLDGSPAVTLAKVPPLRGATWASNDIVFATNESEGRLWRVPVAGGMPEVLTRLDSKDRRSHSLPHMLPDGRGVFYKIGTPASNFADGQVAVMSLATGETHVVLDHGVDVRYVPSGHLVYVRDGTLMAVPFDLRGLRVNGTPVAVVKGVMQAVRTNFLSVSETGAAQFSVSNTGALVYVPSAPVPNSWSRWCG
jgi:serine/threonine-protein kinase